MADESEWRRRLASVRVSAPQQHHELRSWWCLEPEDSERAGRPAVMLYEQQRGGDGLWGRLRTVGPEPRFDAPLLAASQRLFLRPSNWDRGEPDLDDLVDWQGGEPWSFYLAVEKRDDQVVLGGRLRRGDEVRPLGDARFVAGDVVLFGRTLMPLEDGRLTAWVSELRKGEIVLSLAQLDAMLDDLWNLPDLPPVEMPPEWPLTEITGTPRSRLHVRSPRSADVLWLSASVYFDYEERRIPAHDPRTRIVDRRQGFVLTRDEDDEERSIAYLLELGATVPTHREIEGHFQIEPGELSRLVLALFAAGWRVEADGRRVRPPGRVRLVVASGIDWFELRGQADFEGAVLLLPDLLLAIRREERLVVLDDGTAGILPEEWLERYTPLADMWEEGEDHVRFLAGEAVLLEALLEGDEVEADRRFQQARERLRDFRRLEPRHEPPGFGGELRSYQRDGLGWLSFLADFGFGGCLADDMGLGKTIQVLALFEERRRQSETRPPSLVVVPRSLVYNWIHEATRFAPGLRVLGFQGPGRHVWLPELGTYDLVVTTYGTLRHDIDTLAEVAFDYVVLDEAQAIKNATSQTARACRRLQARHRLALTGTPVENHLGELWSIFAFLNPGLTARLPALGRIAGQTRLEPSELEVLTRATRPFILRRTKEAVLADLPEKTEQVLFCDLGERQHKLYDELRDHYRARLADRIEESGLESARLEVLEALLRLRQAACHPALIDPARGREPSAKLGILEDHLIQVIEEGHKALVFSQFTSFLALVRRLLERRGIPYEYLDGATRDRRVPVERFQGDDGCPIFLISLKAGGVGLNLTAADYVFLLDPWWNPAVEAQAIDRAHRMGQKRPVLAQRLIARETVEEKILLLQEQKRDLADAILKADESLAQALTAEDLRWLLG